MFNLVTTSMCPFDIFKTKYSPFFPRQNMVIFCITNINFFSTKIANIRSTQFPKLGCCYFSFIFAIEIMGCSAKTISLRGSVIDFFTSLTPRMKIFSIRSHTEFINIFCLFTMRTFSFSHDLIISHEGQKMQLKINHFRRFFNVSETNFR